MGFIREANPGFGATPYDNDKGHAINRLISLEK
jgi:hypothetical protein